MAVFVVLFSVSVAVLALVVDHDRRYLHHHYRHHPLLVFFSYNYHVEAVTAVTAVIIIIIILGSFDSNP